ncbi:phosphotransferase [Nonomuraea sp. H19]|uniref:phosphotransferase n=1 Tax=Nonomuraea sp. H19 TaxID=3452206 RepID=UPI003F8B0B09
MGCRCRRRAARRLIACPRTRCGVPGRRGRRLPVVLTHGDFSARNLLASAGTTVLLDWATLDAGPVGADLAALALSTFADPVEDYLAGADGRFARDDVELGYRATLALTGAGAAALDVVTRRATTRLLRGLHPLPGPVRCMNRDRCA